MRLVYVIYRCGHYVFGLPAKGRAPGKYQVAEDCLACRGFVLGQAHNGDPEARFERRGRTQRWTRVASRPTEQGST